MSVYVQGFPPCSMESVKINVVLSDLSCCYSECSDNGEAQICLNKMGFKSPRGRLDSKKDTLSLRLSRESCSNTGIILTGPPGRTV